MNTLKLISQHDISGVSIDMVAGLSRVSKATLYRRWKSRDELIHSALSYLEVPLNIPDTGNIRDDLTALLQGLVEFLNKPDGGRVYAAFLNASVHDPKLGAFRRELSAKASVPYDTVLNRGVARGEIRLDIPRRLAIDLLIAPFSYHRIATNTTSRADDIKPVVDFFLKACQP